MATFDLKLPFELSGDQPSAIEELYAGFREGESGAASVPVWGSGTLRREFLHVDDLADALVFLMQNYDGDGFVNVGVGEDVTIRELAELVRRIVGYEGAVEFDPAKPDGTPRKLMDVSRLTELSWRARIGLEEGIRSTYDWYRGSLEREDIRPGAPAAI